MDPIVNKLLQEGLLDAEPSNDYAGSVDVAEVPLLAAIGAESRHFVAEGPNDFAQSLGYPGEPDHPEVVRAMQDITNRIHQAGRMMQADVMQGAWVSDILLDAGRRILPA